eukprot:804734-Lingulodinium_polyedra.AAC.1
MADGKKLDADEEYIEGMVHARNRHNKLLKGVAADAWQGTIDAHHEALRDLDDMWGLEQCLLRALSREAGASIMERKLLSCIPHADAPAWTLGAAINKVEELASWSLCS